MAASGGAMPVGEMMKRRVVWFSSGLVLGSKAFVQEVYQSVKEKVGWRRENRAVKKREGFCVLRGGEKEVGGMG